MGEQDAATRYLEKSTFDALYNEFKPVIIASLDKFNARDYWKKGASAYNKIPLTKEVTTELDDYVTQQALVGMFSLVEKKKWIFAKTPLLVAPICCVRSSQNKITR